MSGQSASLTLKEAKAMQERTTCGPDSQGTRKTGGAKGSHEVLKKEKGAQN